MKKILANTLLICLSLAAALALAEFTVRLLYEDRTVLFPRYHTDFRYGRYTLRGIRPNVEFRHTSVDGTWTFVTNSRGFRNTTDFPYRKAPHTVRVLSLGDSQAQGYEVRQEATFSSVLEQFLTARHVQAEVLNSGVSGFSTAEELAFLENEGYRYEPDVVVLPFYANDYIDNIRTGLFRLDAERLVEAKFEYVPGVRIQNAIYRIPGVKWLGEHSYFYSMLFNNVWQFAKMTSRKRAAQQAPSGSTAEPSAAEEFELAIATRSGPSSYEMALAVALIKRMQMFCSERGIRLIVVDIPVRTGPREFRPSFGPAVLAALADANIEHITSDLLFADYHGAVELHVPHGSNHISEFTHALVGVELGRRILAGGVRSSKAGTVGSDRRAPRGAQRRLVLATDHDEQPTVGAAGK